MTDISPINPSYSTPPLEGARASEARRAGEGSSRRVDEADTAEFSERAQRLSLLARLRELPEIRSELVDRVRSEIAAGSYETPERLDGAADALAREISLLG
jgi:anti-sigma28 factor (negative regulator of flagellin synthesis)